MDEIGQWAGQATVVGLAVVVLRYGLVWVVVLWALRADAAGREFALALLRLLSPRRAEEVQQELSSGAGPGQQDPESAKE